jgi:putative ABC transport system ATP-binding protein
MLALNRRRGATLVLVTHEQELASRADRRIFLRDGQVVADETSSPSDPNANPHASESNTTGPSRGPDATERASDSDATALAEGPDATAAEESNANPSAEELEAARP